MTSADAEPGLASRTTRLASNGDRVILPAGYAELVIDAAFFAGAATFGGASFGGAFALFLSSPAINIPDL
jgi:hypothetical protein